MEFEEFVPLFANGIARAKRASVGIRADESLNRFRTIASRTKETFEGKQFTTKVTDNVYNVYPIYDWRTQDIWIYHARNPENHITTFTTICIKLAFLLAISAFASHTVMISAGVHFIGTEPETWAKSSGARQRCKFWCSLRSG